MPRRTLYPENKTNMKKPIPEEMFTNLRAGRSRKAFKVKEPNNEYIVAIVVCLMIVACGFILLFGFMQITEPVAPTPVDENPGCIASAYQATQNGFDLEANLAACN